MKKALLSAGILFGGFLATGQTTATNFTATDCSSGSHTLFTELDAGKVVVLVWVMPCASCISDAKASYDVVQSFATAHPGKVLYWMADDHGDNPCSSLTGWASTNSIGTTGSTFFGNAGSTINEADYGGTGMPHVVVMGGTDHHIYYNKKNGSNDGTEITTAVNSAIAATGVAQIASADKDTKVFPNPAKNKASVSYTLENQANVSIEVYDVLGGKVKTLILGAQFSGAHSVDLNFENKLVNGIYTLKINTDNTSQTVKFAIAD